MYPKVLIIGQSFNLNTGGGITLTNLFNGWDKDRIAIASERITKSDLDICGKHYQLGYCENKRKFPFNLFQVKYKSGLIQSNTNVQPQNHKRFLPDSVKSPNLHKLYNSILHFFGLYHYSKSLIVSENFIEWIKIYKPDIIYTQLASLELIRFVTKLQNETKIPVAIHMMDDWPQTISKNGMLKIYWRNLINSEFRYLISQSSIFLSISDGMSEEYLKRYNKQFLPFHNPIIVETWLPFSKQNYETKNEFRILYTGRIGIANGKAIIDIAKAVKELQDKGLNLKLEILTSDIYTIKAREMRMLYNTTINQTIPHSEIPKLLSTYDLLVLPLDFDKKGIKFAKYSMPTKASEYMISGTPILVYAPNETVLCQHAKKYKWAYVVDKNNHGDLVKAFNEIIINVEQRKTLGKIAKVYAEKFYNADVVRNNFKIALTSNMAH